ncbi:MAG: exodeoxyribonuclease VII large subunit [Flavobacteriales bacterium]|nr:exodeoxyribonuclease VII large subunit [Flavobacteriales bacterium]
MSVSTEKKHIYTLLQLAENIRQTLQRTYTAQYWIKAELHKLNYYSRSGHCYPEFTEKNHGKIVAEMRGMIWKDAYLEINRRFEQVTGETLRDGINILMLVSVQFHPVNGLKLVVEDIDPQYTLGDLARQRAECIERLKNEGLYDLNKSLPFPVLPKRLAIISVETSKGYHDLLSIIDGNEQGYRFQHTLFPAFLQGEQAVSSITAQLKAIAQHADKYDLILLIRGGGGDAGLSAYDQYELASAVAQAPLPVLTGIGHASNQTVTELVAARNLITPSETGYFLIQQFQQIELQIDEWTSRMKQQSETLLGLQGGHLLELTRRFQVSGAQAVYKSQQTLQHMLHALALQTNQILQRHHQQLYDVWPDRLQRYTEHLITQHSHQLNQQEEKVNLLSPEATLKRGYSITYHNGKVLTSSRHTTPGDSVLVQLYDGQLITVIQNTIHHAS